VFFNFAAADCKFTKVGATITCAFVLAGILATNSFNNSSVCAAFLCIFQFPATIDFLILVVLYYFFVFSLNLSQSPKLIFEF
jgi:hypothetical protein